MAFKQKKPGKLYIRNSTDPSDTLLFQFNPPRVNKRFRPLYANITAAGADYASYSNKFRGSQFVNNQPVSLMFELQFVSDDLLGDQNGSKDVTTPLGRLERFMLVDNIKRDVPDLVYDNDEIHVVRIRDCERVVEHWSEDMKPKRATVRITLEIVYYGRK